MRIHFFTAFFLDPYDRCENLSTVHSDGPPSLSGKDNYLCPPAAAKGPVLAGGQVLCLG